MSQAFETGLLPGGLPLPLVARPVGSKRSKSDLIALIESERAWIEEKVLEHGGVLFRGFELDNSDDFQQAAQAVIPALKPYVEGQSPRTKVGANVYTSTEYPKHLRITLHSELSYVKNPPPKLLFFCDTPATQGGETPIVDTRQVYLKMPEALRAKFETLNVKYVKNMPGNEKGLGKTWMGHYETDDKKAVEKYLNENEMTYEWLPDGGLRTESNRPAIRTHPVTGEKVWYNQANLWHITNLEPARRKVLMQVCGEKKLPTHCYFGDGSVMSEAELDTVRKVMWDNAAIFPWEKGDLLVLDNILTAHGRMTFDGPRKTLVAMG